MPPSTCHCSVFTHWSLHLAACPRGLEQNVWETCRSMSSIMLNITPASVSHRNQIFTWRWSQCSTGLITHRNRQVLQQGELLRVHTEQQSADRLGALPGASVLGQTSEPHEKVLGQRSSHMRNLKELPKQFNTTPLPERNFLGQRAILSAKGVVHTNEQVGHVDVHLFSKERNILPATSRNWRANTLPVGLLHCRHNVAAHVILRKFHRTTT